MGIRKGEKKEKLTYKNLGVGLKEREKEKLFTRSYYLHDLYLHIRLFAKASNEYAELLPHLYDDPRCSRRLKNMYRTILTVGPNCVVPKQ